MTALLIFLGVVVVLILLGWLGLRIKPQPFPAFAEQAAVARTVPLPDGLPAPVERYYLQIYGESVPVIESAVLTGRATMRLNGITFPARFRFTTTPGRATGTTSRPPSSACR